MVTMAGTYVITELIDDFRNANRSKAIRLLYVLLLSLAGKFVKDKLENTESKAEVVKPIMASVIMKYLISLFQLAHLMPDPGQIMQWFYRSPHFRIELRESIMDMLAAHFDTFKSFQRRTKDAWTVLVDPGLAGNARMACNDLAVRLPRLRGLTMHHVLEVAKNDADEHNNMFTDYFCGAIAARWRANSVFAAQPYKTRNEQNAVMQAVADARAFA